MTSESTTELTPDHTRYNYTLIFILLLNAFLQSYILSLYADYSFLLSGSLFGGLYLILIAFIWVYFIRNE